MFDARDAVLWVLHGESRTRTTLAGSRLATVLLLVDPDGPLVRAAVEALTQRGHAADATLIEHMYHSLPSRLRPLLAGASVMAFLPPDVFRGVWRDALKRCVTGAERGRLAEVLLAFLNRNPQEAEQYRPNVRSFVGDCDHVARRSGVLLLSTLRAPRGEDFRNLSRALTSRRADARLAALGAVQRWLARSEDVPPSVDAYLGSEEVARAARLATRDSDQAVRMAGANCERYLTLRAQRIARDPGRRVRRPRHEVTQADP